MACTNGALKMSYQHLSNEDSTPSKKCPKCGLWSTKSAIRCDCGYNYETGMIDGIMYCPQCGTLIQNKAIACQNCGAQLNDLDDSTIDPEFGNVSRMKPVVRLSKISFWMGILAIIPYFFAILSMVYYGLFPTTPTTSHWVKLTLRFIFYPALLGLISGFPFGLAAIITGFIGNHKQPKVKKDVVASNVGALLGIGGIAGHIWYIWIVATCQFCQ